MDGNRVARMSVTWRSRQLDVDADPNCTVKEFGQLLQDLTNVKPETLKLIVPQSTTKGSKLIMPFSDSHSGLTLKEAAVSEGKPIRMMGVFDDEIEEVSDNGKRPDMRIIGFDEEEQRLRQRSSGRPKFSLKLPQGQYIFCDFRTLHLPGIELNPPPSEALKRMHMLACDPGIIAIMNKHRWRVGIMTEMAPVGYVGVSPKCILGFNKNMGEEISLRLRTDDLKGFRKYESIKKTLLHELAHMVHSEHDANFFALNKQLNEEAASLDWTKSSGHVLSGRKIFDSYEDEFVLEPDADVVGHKLGGGSSSSASAGVLSGAAAYQRLLNAASTDLGSSHNRVVTATKRGNMQGTQVEPDPDDDDQDLVQEIVKVEPDPDDNDAMHVDIAIVTSGPSGNMQGTQVEPDPDDNGKDLVNGIVKVEPDPDDNDAMHVDVAIVTSGTSGYSEPDPDDAGEKNSLSSLEPDPDDSPVVGILNKEMKIDVKHCKEPDPDDGAGEFVLDSGNKMEVEREPRGNTSVLKSEPDPDDSSNAILNKKVSIGDKHMREPDPDASTCGAVMKSGNNIEVEIRPSNSLILKSEPDPDDHAVDLSSNELQRIEEPVTALFSRLQKAIEMLRLQATPPEAATVLQTLFKIIKNVIENPNDIRYRRLRKSNPHFQRSVANYKAAMEVLELIGFCEDVVSDEIGRAEAYLVLKRNDPGLLWLVKSSLEVSMA
ncbi:uncharacterized protein LOC100839730 [Brachypodium distachyon]|uniref:WLM domain-containing protein n=1 Tax=Brachypodium distachyon TaxID=15368 RepID=I1I8C2_BRADI|nr:uncharacterized protein LOC100839730 [Brachypodium distachyon]KQJ98865.1 hypothetical protein BRADI_3g39600v3 [Brachypodium distachyon]|eukprot:XP_010235282.1 uncharacterized protein LOC100839730 [Brachypodium distachyon]